MSEIVRKATQETPLWVIDARRAYCVAVGDGFSDGCRFPKCACESAPELALIRAGMEAAAKIADHDLRADSAHHAAAAIRAAIAALDRIRGKTKT